MTTTELLERAREALAKSLQAEDYLLMDENDPNYLGDNWYETCDLPHRASSAVDAILALFQSYVGELIGEDEPVDEEAMRDSASDDQPIREWVKEGRNALRREMRKEAGLE